MKNNSISYLSITLMMLLTTRCSLIGLAQETESIYKKTFENVKPLALDGCNREGEPVASKGGIDFPAKSKFFIVKDNGTDYVIRFQEWKDSTVDEKFNVDNTTGTSSAAYYIISKSKFEAVCREHQGQFRGFYLGNGIVPVKLRNAPFDFSKDITLGPMFSIKTSVIGGGRPESIHWTFGAGITSVSLDSANTKGKILQPEDRAAFTLSCGVIFELVDHAQFGILMGWDHISQKESVDWIYQGKPWFSIGLGYTIFSIGSGNQSAGKN